MIEELEDIIEGLANKLGIYGIHDEERCTDRTPCRVCWTADLNERIRTAVNVERILSK